MDASKVPVGGSRSTTWVVDLTFGEERGTKSVLSMQGQLILPALGRWRSSVNIWG